MTPTVKNEKPPVEVLILAVPETAGSALYGMLDVLKSAGNVWQTLTMEGDRRQLFNVQIVSLKSKMFSCGNGIPVKPDCVIANAAQADIIILPELWLGPEENIKGRYPEVVTWLCDAYERGSALYSACSGAILLAESGLLNGCEATSHWAYKNLFREQYPNVHFLPEPNLVIADPNGRIVTAGGTTSWHDLAIYIIARHANPGEAVRIAKIYLLKWHDEGQLAYAALPGNLPHTDGKVRQCQERLRKIFRDPDAIQQVIDGSGIPERTLKRRFKAATGSTFIEYLQNLRIDEAKRLLETTARNTDDISADVGYEDVSFFRRLFKRITGLTPAEYRRLFQPIVHAKSAVQVELP